MVSEKNGSVVKGSGGYKGSASKPGLALMYPSAVICLLGALSIGTVIGYPTVALEGMRRAPPPLGERLEDSDVVTWFTSLMAIGALPGAFLAGPMANSLGRRATIIAASVPFVGGWLLISSSTSLVQLFAGRVLTGLCTGMLCVAAPIYLVEVSSKEMRGVLGGLFGGTVSSGILFAGVFGGLLLDWHHLALLNAVLPLLMGVAMFFMPESPKLLISKGRFEDGADAINSLHGSAVDARLQALLLKEECERQTSGGLRLADISSRSTRKSALIAVSLMLFQQFSGINAVMVYAVSIFRTSAPSLDAIHCTILIQAIQAIVTLSASKITSRFGRRRPLIFSSFAMLSSLSAFGVYQYLVSKGYNLSSYSFLPVLFCVVSVIGFSVGFGPLPWLVVAEIAPIRVSGLISALATATNWASFFVLIKMFDIMTALLHDYGVYWLYAGCSMVALFFVIFYLPETAGKSSEEIRMILDGVDKTVPEEDSRDSPMILVHNQL